MQKTPSTPTEKQQVRQQKQQVRPILIDAVLSRCNFCRKFKHFSGVQFTGQKMRWRTKMTNLRYEHMSKKIMEIERTGGKVLIPDQYKYNTKVKHCPP